MLYRPVVGHGEGRMHRNQRWSRGLRSWRGDIIRAFQACRRPYSHRAGRTKGVLCTCGSRCVITSPWGAKLASGCRVAHVFRAIFFDFISDHAEHSPDYITNSSLSWLCFDQSSSNLLDALEKLGVVGPFELGYNAQEQVSCSYGAWSRILDLPSLEQPGGCQSPSCCIAAAHEVVLTQ